MKKLIRWCRENHLSKIWLESYRHGEIVPSDLLMAERDELRRAGFEVCGLVTPTSLGPAGEDGNSPIEVCWSNSQARERLSGEIRRTAEMFDVIIIDDFLFTNHDDECPSCASDKAGRGIEDWEEYRRALLMEVSLENIIKPAKEVNPSVQVIIKYPCWWQDWEKRGYSPAAQAELFGKCWIGTETRDANPDPTQSCWIVDHIDRLTGGRCAGGWYDGLDCSPHRFLLQAYYTILGGAKESLIHCYDYLLASDPGRTPYGEKSNRSHECAAAFEEKSDDIYNLAQLLCGAEAVSYEIDENDVSTHVYRKDGDTLVVKFDANSLSWMQAEPSAIGLLKVE